jgi:uncharacterized protein
MDQIDPLTPLDPAYVTVTRIMSGILALIPIIGAVVVEFARVAPPGIIITPTILLAAYWAWLMPQRRYNHWGYSAGADQLRIVRGYLFYRDTIVPYSRIQHMDVDQGPIERPYGLATFSAHTAGTHGSTIVLPGLPHADALALRECIRDYIKHANR